MHRKLERVREKRHTALERSRRADGGLVARRGARLRVDPRDGTSIRLTGEDVERGTFSHRHAVFHDVNNGRVHVPLQALPQAKAAFEIHNSPLTENAVIGFEYGYNIQEPSRLVIWEAQYGDFINGAQVMIDEFIVSARGKWGLRPSLVLLLPHAHEGQGPDHASARPERFLQLAADLNMRVANCTTAAQYFHLLRRQAALLTVDPLPLIVLTPKSLLRHPLVASAPRELAEGRFRMVLPDTDAIGRAADVRRVLVCTGKVYMDLVATEQRAARPDVAICRLEQLYPVPMRDLRAMLDDLPERRRDRVGPGRAGEHGRLGLHPSAPAGSLGRPDGAPRRAAAQRQPGRRLGGAPRAQSAGARQPGLRAAPRGADGRRGARRPAATRS